MAKYHYHVGNLSRLATVFIPDSDNCYLNFSRKSSAVKPLLIHVIKRSSSFIHQFYRWICAGWTVLHSEDATREHQTFLCAKKTHCRISFHQWWCSMEWFVTDKKCANVMVCYWLRYGEHSLLFIHFDPEKSLPLIRLSHLQKVFVNFFFNL